MPAVSRGAYAPGRGSSGYGWAICPTFADCLDTNEASHQHANTEFASDATAGKLPAFSILIPTAANSQHNGQSMLVGDNWIAKNVESVMSGPDWSSTAIFITWDDCGCFYDHLAPTGTQGIRVPMIIVSPYAKAAYDDSTPASFNSLLAFTEHVFGLAPLNSSDGSAYDYANSFTVNLSPTAAPGRPVPHGTVDLAQHPLTPPSSEPCEMRHPTNPIRTTPEMADQPLSIPQRAVRWSAKRWVVVAADVHYWRAILLFHGRGPEGRDVSRPIVSDAQLGGLRLDFRRRARVVGSYKPRYRFRSAIGIVALAVWSAGLFSPVAASAAPGDTAMSETADPGWSVETAQQPLV